MVDSPDPDRDRRYVLAKPDVRVKYPDLTLTSVMPIPLAPPNWQMQRRQHRVRVGKADRRAGSGSATATTRPRPLASASRAYCRPRRPAHTIAIVTGSVATFSPPFARVNRL